jgi:hypothetical protein
VVKVNDEKMSTDDLVQILETIDGLFMVLTPNMDYLGLMEFGFTITTPTYYGVHEVFESLVTIQVIEPCEIKIWQDIIDPPEVI